jgi:hypothetical protein
MILAGFALSEKHQQPYEIARPWIPAFAGMTIEG